MATSLPNVLGAAGWPCVRLYQDGSQPMRHAGQFSMISASFGKTVPRALQDQSGTGFVDASLVQAKWMNSLAAATQARRSVLHQYSDGFDVVIGGRLNGFDGGGIFKVRSFRSLCRFRQA